MSAVDASVEADRKRTFPDDVRWISAEEPDVDYVERLRFLVNHYGVELADAVVDGAEGFELEWRRDLYVRQRDEYRHIQDIHDRMYAPRKPGGWRFPGHIVFEADLLPGERMPSALDAGSMAPNRR